jgi:hypothetical protein
MHQGGAMGDPAADIPVPDGYTSVISRDIDDIPVAESFAWASFNANGEVIEESVYWPTIPGSIVQEAKAFRDFVADPSTGPAFLSHMSAADVPGKVFIHHGAGDPWSPDETAVSYDVLRATGAGSAQTHHFDRQGVEFKLKYESVAKKAQTPKPAPPAR